MPFTPSHAAAAIPFLRTRLVPSALVIGCMAPDFEYFALFRAGGGFGHTLPGIFTFDIAASLVALWLFHVYAKEPIYAWLPESVRQRFEPGPREFPARNAAQFALVCLSILIGVATHLMWDSLTHRDFWPYHHWQFLHRSIHLPIYGLLEYPRVIQHASTVLGAAVLLLWFWNWYRNTAPIHPQTPSHARENTRSALLVIFIAAMVAGALRGLLSTGMPMDIGTFIGFLGDAVVSAISVFWLGVVAYGAYSGRARAETRRGS